MFLGLGLGLGLGFTCCGTTSAPLGVMPRFHEYTRWAPLPSNDVKLKLTVVRLVVYCGACTLRSGHLYYFIIVLRTPVFLF